MPPVGGEPEVFVGAGGGSGPGRGGVSLVWVTSCAALSRFTSPEAAASPLVTRPQFPLLQWESYHLGPRNGGEVDRGSVEQVSGGKLNISIDIIIIKCFICF